MANEFTSVRRRRVGPGVALALTCLGGCASGAGGAVNQLGGAIMGKPTLSPSDVPSLYEQPAGLTVAHSSPLALDAACSGVRAELGALDMGLGGPAADKPPERPAGVKERVIDYGRDLAVQTVLGYVQPVLQTKRAIMNDEERARRRVEAQKRGEVRRAYLRGVSEGLGCDRPAATPDSAAVPPAEPAPVSGS